jgi:L-lactate dehydrogenase complex protein LldF
MAGVGIEVIETDLGERIQQLDHEEPAHVIGPAIHKTREDVAEVFARNLGSDPNDTDIPHLASVQREATRPLILKAEAGMTGCNFAVAETGTVVVCTNEGNADLSANTPPLHIASIGIEKIIPRFEHLAVFRRLLARNAIGTPMTQYTSHFRAPRAGAADEALRLLPHFVLANPLNTWTSKGRDMPAAPPQTFHAWWREHRPQSRGHP